MRTEFLSLLSEKQKKIFFLHVRKKAQVALGSDAGAYMVMHGNGIVDEYTAFRSVLGDSDDLENWLRQGENEIKIPVQASSILTQV